MKKFAFTGEKEIFQKRKVYFPFVLEKTGITSYVYQPGWINTENKCDATKWLSRQKLKYKDTSNVSFVLKIEKDEYFEI
jgi:hypothetical protein